MLSTHHFPPESIISQCFSTCCIEICLRKYVICCRYVLYTRYTPDSVRLVPLVLSARRILLTRDSLHLQKLNWFRFVCTFPLLPFAAKSKQKQNNPIYTSFFLRLWSEHRWTLNSHTCHLSFLFLFCSCGSIAISESKRIKKSPNYYVSLILSSLFLACIQIFRVV